MDIITIQQQLEEVRGKATITYQEYFEAKTSHDNLEEMKKPMLAGYELEYAREGGPQAEIARRALGDKRYIEWLVGLNQARANMNQKLANVKALEMILGSLQSQSKNYFKDQL